MLTYSSVCCVRVTGNWPCGSCQRPLGSWESPKHSDLGTQGRRRSHSSMVYLPACSAETWQSAEPTRALLSTGSHRVHLRDLTLVAGRSTTGGMGRMVPSQKSTCDLSLLVYFPCMDISLPSHPCPHFRDCSFQHAPLKCTYFSAHPDSMSHTYTFPPLPRVISTSISPPLTHPRKYQIEHGCL